MDLTQEILFENTESEEDTTEFPVLNRQSLQSAFESTSVDNDIEEDINDIEDDEDLEEFDFHHEEELVDEEVEEDEELIVEETEEINPYLNVINNKTEIVLQHSFTDLIVNITKLKDKSLKAVLTKFKENLSIVPKISDDDLTISINNKTVNLSTTVEAGTVYTIYSQHSVKG